jgi:hypothetical protein
VLISAPAGHPAARKTKGQNYGSIYEHRLMMESMIGRYLQDQETVDHIDGLRLHNTPSNLRLFSSNADHLKATISGQVPKWSQQGRDKMFLPTLQKQCAPRIDTYRQKKIRGDARLIQILLAALRLGIDSPFLLGSSLHLEKAGISDLSDSNLKLELARIYRKYE